MKHLALILAAVALTACQPHPKPATDNPRNVRADDVVVLDATAHGCVTLGDFDAAHKARLAGELARWAEMTSTRPACFVAQSLRPGQTFTVMQVQDQLMQISVTTLEQYKNDRSLYGITYWTATRWGTPVR